MRIALGQQPGQPRERRDRGERQRVVEHAPGMGLDQLDIEAAEMLREPGAPIDADEIAGLEQRSDTARTPPGPARGASRAAASAAPRLDRSSASPERPVERRSFVLPSLHRASLGSLRSSVLAPRAQPVPPRRLGRLHAARGKDRRSQSHCIESGPHSDLLGDWLERSTFALWVGSAADYGRSAALLFFGVVEAHLAVTLRVVAPMLTHFDE